MTGGHVSEQRVVCMVAGVVVRVVAQAVVVGMAGCSRCHRKPAGSGWVQGRSCRCCCHTRSVCVVVQRVRVMMVMVAHPRQTARILVVVVSGGKVMMMRV